MLHVIVESGKERVGVTEGWEYSAGPLVPGGVHVLTSDEKASQSREILGHRLSVS